MDMFFLLEPKVFDLENDGFPALFPCYLKKSPAGCWIYEKGHFLL